MVINSTSDVSAIVFRRSEGHFLVAHVVKRFRVVCGLRNKSRVGVEKGQSKAPSPAVSRILAATKERPASHFHKKNFPLYARSGLL